MKDALTQFNHTGKLLLLSSVFLLFLIIFSSMASAAAGAAGAAAAASRTRQDQINLQNQGGCTPPIEFAKEHNCKLYYKSYEVAGYTCRNTSSTYSLQGDCKGGATIVYENHYEELTTGSLIWFFIPLVLFFLVVFITNLIRGWRHG